MSIPPSSAGRPVARPATAPFPQWRRLRGYAAENAFGLEQMTHRDLVCVVPVDVKMSKAMNWGRTLPWQPLLTRLGEMTRGRLILTDPASAAPEAAALTLLSPAERKRFAKAVTVTEQYVDFTR